MKKNFTLLMLFLASFFFSANVMAQYQHEITEEVKSDYSTTDIGFPLSEVASALNTDAATLAAAFDEWASAGYPSTDIFVLETPDGGTSTTHSADYGGYYMDKDGSHGWWADNGYWYSILGWDLENDKLYIQIGQNPTKTITPGEQFKCKLSVNYNGLKVTFEITLNIKVSEGIDKESVITIADLEIVGRTTYKHTQEPDATWTNEPNTVYTEGIAELLGIDPDYMAEKFKYMLYTKKYDLSVEAWSPELINDFTATPSPGFWFSSGVWDEINQVELPELRHGAYGDNNKHWVASLQFLPESSSVYCTIGQYPNAWSLGENHTADIYIVYGNKAYIITYDLTVDVTDLDPITNYNKLGSSTITLKRNPCDGWDVEDTCTIDMSGILALFANAGSEITADDLVLHTTDEYGSVYSEYSTDSVGFWFTPEGAVTNYSAGAKKFYVNYTFDADNAHCFSFGNTPDVFLGGEKCTATLYLINGKNYYEFVVDMDMENAAYAFEECEFVDYDLVVEMIPSASSWEIGKTDASFIAEIIGTSTGTFYGVASDSTITNNYTVSEATTYGGGGFWMSPDNEDGYAFAAGYSGTGSFAVWYYQDKLTWFAIPGFRQAGETSYATFYVANLWGGKAVKLNVTLKFINEKVAYSGTEDICIAGRDAETDDYAEVAVDTEKCFAALGCTEELFVESGFYALYTKNGVLSTENLDDTYGFIFNSEGYAFEDGDEPAGYVGIVEGALRAYILGDADVNTEYNITLIASYDSKLYAYNITISTEKATGIVNVEKTEVKDAVIYDLSGRVVTLPLKGMYIQGGEEVLG